MADETYKMFKDVLAKYGIEHLNESGTAKLFDEMLDFFNPPAVKVSVKELNNHFKKIRGE